MLGYKRSTRVAELIQQEISKIVQRMQPPELGLITITGIKLTDDLRSARVFYSVIADNDKIEQAKIFVEGSIQSIRYELAQGLNLRRTPTLVFEFDETPSRATRIFEILDKIKSENKAPVKKKKKKKKV